MSGSERPGIMMYFEVMDEVQYMTDLQLGQLFRAMMSYGRYGEIVDDIDPMVMGSFYCIKRRIDQDAETYAKKVETYRQNALKRKSRTSSIQNSNEPLQAFADETEQLQATAGNCSYNYNPNPNTNNNYYNYNTSEGEQNAAAYESAPPRGMYENVYLSVEEYEKLRLEYPNIDESIDRLSEYMETSGKSYVNHFATLRQWAREDGQKAPVKGATDSSAVQKRWSNELYPAGEHEKEAVRRLFEMKRRREAELQGAASEM